MSKKNKKKKRRIVLSILLLILTPCYILLNLGQNSIYYYIHSKKTDKKLTPIVVVNNMEWVMKKPRRETVGKYQYQNGSILYMESDTFSYYFSRGVGLKDINTIFGEYNESEDLSKSYYLSPKLKILTTYHNFDKVTPTEEEKESVYKRIKQLTDHVIKTRVEPPIFFNLQWLYDLTFDEKDAYNLNREYELNNSNQ